MDSDGMHMCLLCRQPAYNAKTTEYQKVKKRFREMYDPVQMTTMFGNLVSANHRRQMLQTSALEGASC